MQKLDFRVHISCWMLSQVGKQLHSAQGDAGFKNTWEGLTIIVRNQGWRQLFAGLSINYIKVIAHALC